ncbi:MAG: hypothetical protein J5606_04880, partial [Bacteroidales bacterium]|nr:hypothetical protein [Bacteroidales bacterium]
MRLYRYFLCTVSLILMSISTFGQSSCPNLDFSMKNFTNWQAYRDKYKTGSTNIYPITLFSTIPISGQHTIYSFDDIGTAKDEKCDKIQKIPNGFLYSCKLGNEHDARHTPKDSINSNALEYTMTVDSNNSLLLLSFAYIMQQAGHTAVEQPTFKLQIRDMADNIITSLGCSDVTLISDKNDPDLVCRGTSSTSINGKDWTTVGFNLDMLMGQTIKIRFQIIDCKYAYHWGYAYFVAECRPMTIDLMFCEGSTEALMRAPDGFVTYQWTRTSKPGWSSSDTQINVSDYVDGEVFECVVTSKMGCTSTLRTVMARTIIDPNFYYGIRTGPNSVDIYDKDGNYTSKYDTCTRTATMVDLSTVRNGHKGQITWEVHGLDVISHDSLFTFTFPNPPNNTPRDYLLKLTVEAGNGCVDTSIVIKEHQIRIFPSAEVEISGPQYLCDNVKDTLRVKVINSYFIQHEWGGVTYDGTSIGTQVGNTLPISKAGTYWVKSLDTVNCYAYDTIHITHLSPSVNITHSDVLCYGELSGVITQGAITGGGDIETAYWVMPDKSGRDSIVNAIVSGGRYEQLRAGTYRFYSKDEYSCELFDTVVVTQPDSLRDTISQDSTVCYLPKGKVSVQVNGGTTPYTYV